MSVALDEEVDGDSGEGGFGDLFPADGGEGVGEVAEGGFFRGRGGGGGVDSVVEVFPEERVGGEGCGIEGVEDVHALAAAGDGDIEDVLAFGEAAGALG